MMGCRIVAVNTRDDAGSAVWPKFRPAQRGSRNNGRGRPAATRTARSKAVSAGAPFFFLKTTSNQLGAVLVVEEIPMAVGRQVNAIEH